MHFTENINIRYQAAFRQLNLAGLATKSATILAVFAVCLSPVSAQNKPQNPYEELSTAIQSAGSVCLPKQDDGSGAARVSRKVEINAPPEVVWLSVHEERKHDPDLAYSKVLEEKDDTSVLEQKFNFIPILGSATCVMNLSEVPLKRIDYHMVKSDHFKAFDGSWVLTPADDGKHTILELTSHLDMGMPVPKFFMNSCTGKKLDKRLANVKHMAESMNSNAKVAHKHDANLH